MKQTMFAKGYRLLYREPVRCMALFLVGHLLVFRLLEQLSRPVHRIGCRLDEYLPFCSGAIWPYLGWCLWVPGMLFWLLAKDRSRFCRGFAVLVAGDVFTLAVYAVWPTGLTLRSPVPGTGLSAALVRLLYQMDTPTNVCPSLHVFLTVALLCAAWQQLPRWGRWLQGLTGLAICLSTVLLDQHSVLDVLAGGLLAVMLWQLSGLRLRRRALVRRTA